MKDEISIHLPESYIGKEVEVIVFATDEGRDLKGYDRKEIPFVVLSVDDKHFRFDRDEANER
jgi:hypothetical protein